MSREFGSYTSGYFHTQMEQAAEDCLGGKDPLTKLWGEFLKEFSGIAYEIANSEACDSGPDAPICETIRRLPALERRLQAVKDFVYPYKRCMENALRQKVEGEK